MNAAAVILVVLLNTHNVFCTLEKQCRDWQGNVIKSGKTFIPDEHDACKKCMCDNGSIAYCSQVSCIPPNSKSCRLEKIPGKCCIFTCVHDKNFEGGFDSTTNNSRNATYPPTVKRDGMAVLGLRLVASSVTSLLILSLLIFMVHRLRQRHLVLARERNAHRRLDEEESFRSRRDPHTITISVPPYEDPPPPYSSPKPNHITDIDPPPPYASPHNQDALSLGEANLSPEAVSETSYSHETFSDMVQSSMSSQGGQSSESFETCSEQSNIDVTHSTYIPERSHTPVVNGCVRGDLMMNSLSDALPIQNTSHESLKPKIPMKPEFELKIINGLKMNNNNKCKGDFNKSKKENIKKPNNLSKNDNALSHFELNNKGHRNSKIHENINGECSQANAQNNNQVFPRLSDTAHVSHSNNSICSETGERKSDV